MVAFAVKYLPAGFVFSAFVLYLCGSKGSAEALPFFNCQSSNSPQLPESGLFLHEMGCKPAGTTL